MLENPAENEHLSSAKADSAEEHLSTLQQAKADLVNILAAVRAVYDAEKDYLSKRFAFTRKQLQKLAICAGLLISFAFCLIVTLVIGGLLIISAYFGPIVATLCMSGALFIISVIIAILARSAMQDLKFK